MVSMWRSKLGGEFSRESIDNLDKEHHLILKHLRSEPHNAHCADCGRANNAWASVNLGVFLCDQCADIHRALGSHVSKVKACTGTDLWGPDEIVQMKELDLVFPNKQSYYKPKDAAEAKKDELMELCIRKYGMKAWACQNTSTRGKTEVSEVSSSLAFGKKVSSIPTTSSTKATSPPTALATKPADIEDFSEMFEDCCVKSLNCSSSLPKERPDFNFDDFFEVLESKTALACVKKCSKQVEEMAAMMDKCAAPDSHDDVHELLEVHPAVLSATVPPPPTALQRVSTDEDMWEGFEDW